MQYERTYNNMNSSRFRQFHPDRFGGVDTVWEDLRFPATAINPAGAANPATYDAAYVGFSFASGATNVIAVIAQMPHSWKLGSTIYPHIHWMPVNTDTKRVLWRMEYKWTNNGEVEAASYTPIDASDNASGVAKTHQLKSITPIAGTGKGLSSILKILISRIGGDPTDDYTDVAILNEFDIHYEIDTVGSRAETVK